LRKVFESSIHPPLELGLNLILQLGAFWLGWNGKEKWQHCFCYFWFE